MQPLELSARQLQVNSVTGGLFLSLAAGIQGGTLDSAGHQWLRSLGNLRLDRVSSGGDIQLQGSGLLELTALRDLEALTAAAHGQAPGEA